MSDERYREQLMTELADRYHPVKRPDKKEEGKQ